MMTFKQTIAKKYDPFQNIRNCAGSIPAEFQNSTLKATKKLLFIYLFIFFVFNATALNKI